MTPQGRKSYIFRIFFALVLAFDSVAVWVISADIKYNNQLTPHEGLFQALYPLSIGAAAIITSLLFERNLRPLALKLPAGKYTGQAILYAFLFTLAPFMLNLLLHLTALNTPLTINNNLVLIGLPIFILLALAEELMWRGFLYTQFSRFLSFPATSISIGLIWAAWRYPAIIHTHLFYSDRPLYFVLPSITFVAVFLSLIYCYLRKVSGSIWPSILLHATINWLFYAFIQPLEKSGYNWSLFFMNNIGILYVMAIMTGGLYFYAVAGAEKKV